MSLKIWEHYFKPEIRTSGSSLVSKGKVKVYQPSETELTFFIQSSSGFKVNFKTPSLTDELLIVDCNCTVGRRNLLCKHIWAGLLATENKKDFFEYKSQLVKKTSDQKTKVQKEPSLAFKKKQALYRKEQYLKQKKRQLERKKDKKKRSDESSFPNDITLAIQYFLENGFELQDSLDRESINAAKKKLARIFHPDLGGKHSEILELNRNSDILLNYFAKQK